jgi:alanine or glycine:cation symporter, AGCS family
MFIIKGIYHAIMAFTAWIWGWPMLIISASIALYLSVRFGFFQFRKFGHCMKNTLGKIFDKNAGDGAVSPFQASCTALASTLGVGNIAGVSVAIATGGVGAIFWMWCVALLGLVVKFSEIALALTYRVKKKDSNEYFGGFFWYVKRGLGKHWTWLSVIWAILLICTMALSPAVQCNALASSVTGTWDINPLIIGIITAALMGLVLIGGLKSISRFAELVVPIMALAYVVVSIGALIRFAPNILPAFGMIFHDAFTGSAAAGGFAGSTTIIAIRCGLARGVYSNEAGTGTAPLAHSSATVDHPVKQALWGIVEVFIDTMVVCTMTSLVVICSGAWQNGSTNAALTAEAFGIAFGNTQFGAIFITIITAFFAFTTAVVNVYYGEVGLEALNIGKAKRPYRIICCVMAIVGSVGALSTIWNLFDFFFGVLALMNLAVIFAMRNKIAAVIRDYLARLKENRWEKSCEETVAKIPEVRVKE